MRSLWHVKLVPCVGSSLHAAGRAATKVHKCTAASCTPAEPTAIKRPASSTEATPLHLPRTDAAVQTGVSLRSRATPASHLRPARLAEQAVQTGASLQERQEEAAGAEEGADLDYGGYDAGASADC